MTVQTALTGRAMRMQLVLGVWYMDWGYTMKEGTHCLPPSQVLRLCQRHALIYVRTTARSDYGREILPVGGLLLPHTYAQWHSHEYLE